MLRKVDIDGPGRAGVRQLDRHARRVELAPGQIAYGALVRRATERWWTTAPSMMRSPDKHPLLRRERPRLRDLHVRQAPAGDHRVARSRTRCRTSACRARKSREMLQALANQDLSNEAFPYYTFREDVEIAGIPVFMTRLGYTAELGYELWVERERALELWDALIERPEPAGDEGDRDGRARPLPDRGRLHHRRHRVRPRPCRPSSAASAGRSTSGRATFQGRAALQRDKRRDAASAARASSSRAAATRPSGARHLRGRRRGRARHAGSRVRRTSTERRWDLRKCARISSRSGARIDVQIGDEQVAGEVVAHPVYDKERRRVKES